MMGREDTRDVVWGVVTVVSIVVVIFAVVHLGFTVLHMLGWT